MSWADICSNCGSHRADCDCGDWNGYEKKKLAKMKEEGYYFVKLKYSKKWTIARFTGILDWYHNGLRLRKDNFDKIGDKIELPKD